MTAMEPVLDALKSLASEDDGRVGHLATLVVHVVEEVDARFGTIELALSELNRRTGKPAEEPTSTVFGIPVALAAGIDSERIRAEIALLPRGLDGPAVVVELEKLGILQQIGDSR